MNDLWLFIKESKALEGGASLVQGRISATARKELAEGIVFRGLWKLRTVLSGLQEGLWPSLRECMAAAEA
jgi:hypothetical protein